MAALEGGWRDPARHAELGRTEAGRCPLPQARLGPVTRGGVGD